MLTEKELMKLEYDKRQIQFAIDGTLIINKIVVDEQTPLSALINSSHYWICPFCLEKSNNFTIENKGLVVCNNCLIGMKMKTLIFATECSNQDYARWVFEYRLSGFFAKLKSGNNSFEKWIQKMKELGISFEFWDEYKKLKGDNQEPQKNFTDYINIIVNQIKSGIDKEAIIIDSYSYDISDSEFNYCFKEAELKIKNNKGV